MAAVVNTGEQGGVEGLLLRKLRWQWLGQSGARVSRVTTKRGAAADCSAGAWHGVQLEGSCG